MILRRLLLLGAGIGALAVSAITTIVALTYALYSLLTPWLGKAGAAGAMFLLIGLAMGAGAATLFAMMPKAPPKPEPAPEPAPLDAIVERISDIVRQRPVAALSAAVGAGVLAIRNPRYLGAALRSMATPRPD